MIRRALGLLGAFLFLALQPGWAADCLSTVGRWPYGPTRATALAGDRLLLGSGYVFQVATAASGAVTILSEIELPGLIDSIVTSGNLAYVTTRHGGLHILDVSDPARPVQVGAADLSAGGFGFLDITGDKLAVANGFLYISPLREAEIRIFDLQNPSNPSLVSTLALGDRVHEIAVSGNLVFVGTWKGLEILDISIPSAPHRLSQWGTTGVSTITLSGSLAYIGTSLDPGFVVLDVSQTDRPSPIGTLEEVYPWDIALFGSLALVADWFGLRVLDVSNPAAPVEVLFEEATDLGSTRILLGAQRAYLTFGDGISYGLAVYDVANARNPRKIGSFSGAGESLRAVASSSYLYVANYNGGLRILDVADPAHPKEVGFFDTPIHTYDVAVSGKYAYLADGEAVRVVNVADPGRPYQVGALTYDKPGDQFVDQIVVAQDRAFVSLSYDGGIAILDISNPSNPRQIGSLSTDYSGALGVEGNLLYFRDSKGLHLVDISEPRTPREVSLIPTSYFGSIKIFGRYAYLAYRVDNPYVATQLRMLDLADPARPVDLGVVLTLFGEVIDIEIENNRAYLLAINTREYLKVLDLTDPIRPRLISTRQSVLFPSSIELAGPNLFVSARENGVVVLDTSSCTACGVDPNELCLKDGRFSTVVSWKDFEGNAGEGQPVRLTSDTGYFWFFDDANVELVIKVLDGTALNGHHWVFYGSLTNVEFQMRVTDLVTGQSKTYVNTAGELVSAGDTSALPAASHATEAQVAADALTAGFRWEPGQPRPGEAVRFFDQSTGGPEGWCWRFGDEPAGSSGCSAVVANPQHTYSEAGTYTAYLRIESELGSPAPKVAEVSHEITIAGDCTYRLVPESASFSAAEGKGSFRVEAPTGCAWEARANLSWIQVTPPALGSGNGTVDFTVRSNSGAARSGAIRVQDKTFSVTQDRAAQPRPNCTPSETVLCLRGNRFSVSVDWKDFEGHTGVARAVSLTPDTGYFWFFDNDNVEVILKILDGRALNGRFWVFYGALSNVEYTVSVTDTVTGASKAYRNPKGRFASEGDTDGLPGE